MSFKTYRNLKKKTKEMSRLSCTVNYITSYNILKENILKENSYGVPNAIPKMDT